MTESSNVLNIPCEACGKPTVIRINRTNNSEFLGCSRWPECTATQPIPTYLAMVRAGAQPLPGLD